MVIADFLAYIIETISSLTRTSKLKFIRYHRALSVNPILWNS